jgi:von Willebrand factor type A domain/von Willebrand factor type A C-terminal domain
MTEPGPAAPVTIELSQQRFLPAGDREAHAIVVVDAAGLGPAPDQAEILLVDCSGSMGHPDTKMRAAQRAAAAAVDGLRDGTLFAVVQGRYDAAVAYPGEPGLAVADPATRQAARAEIAHLTAHGGTAIGHWLLRARELFASRPAAIQHALLLTDGRNEHEDPGQLDQVLAACAGRFSCDARGIGDGWEPAELLRIVSALRGKADAASEEDLAEEFRAITAESMGKVLPDLRLTVRAMPGSRVRFVRQVHPTELDLTGQAVAVDARTTEFGTGSWGPESREYHLCLEVDPTGRPHGEDLQVGVVGMVAVGPDGSRAPAHRAVAGMLVHWTSDLVRATRIDPKLSHYLGQDELRAAVNAGSDGYEAGDLDRARVEWGKAVRIAHRSGNEKVLRRLAGVVEVLDPAAGAVRVRAAIRPRDMKSLIVSSVYAPRGPAAAPGPGPGPDPGPGAGPWADGGDGGAGAVVGPDRVCTNCGLVSPGDAEACERCGHPLTGPGGAP